MSHFDKLTIQGIRCFGPEESEMGMIKFTLPLTLILGNNGCGKTTIIEALKFATCGELPPGSAGPNRINFVHDPKLAGRPEVKGQVRLLVKDVRGDSLSVNRIVQATQRAAKAQFKSVDQVINRMDSNGKWHSITGRCADTDTEMCLALGVSKAVLSNVLLCHQEDSNWPLDEDTKVKAKFDEIFGSERYNKCLDEIRASHKKLTEDEGKLKVQLANLKNYKDDASMLRARLQEANSTLAKYELQLDTFNSQLEPIQERLAELARKDDALSKLRTSLETQKAKLEAVRTTINDLKSSIQHEFKGSKEDLEVAIRNFDKELKEKQSSLEELEIQAEEITMKLTKNQDSLSTEQCRMGQLNGDLEANKKRLDSRSQSMLMLSEELGLTTSVSQLSQADEVQRILFELEGGVMRKENEIDVIKEKHRDEAASLQTENSMFRENRAKIDSSIRGKKEQLQKNREELTKVKESILEADQSAELLGKLQLKLDTIKKELEDLANSNDIDSLQMQIATAKAESNHQEHSLTKLEKEVSDLQLMSQVHAELEVQKNSKNAKDVEIKKLIIRHETELKELLQVSELPEQGIRFQLEARLDQLADTVKNYTDQLRKTEKDITIKEAENKHLAQKLKDAKQQLESDDFAVRQACNGQDYDVYTAELSKKLGDLQDEKGTLSSAEHFYRRYIQKLQKQNPCCPLCKREFAAEQEAKSLVSELSLKVREVPAMLRQNKEQLDQVQEKYEKLLQLKSKHEKVGSLRNAEIPTLEINLERSNNELAKLKKLQAKLQNELEGPQKLESMAKSIHSDICLLEQHISESRRLAKELAKTEDKLKMGPGSKKTLQEAINEQKETRKLLQQTRQSIESFENKLRAIENKKIKLQEEKHAIQDQQFKISGNAQRRAQLSERKDELESVECMIQLEIDKLAGEMASVSRQIEQGERNMKTRLTANSAEMDRFNNEMRSIYKRFEDIKQLNSDIVEYELSGNLKKLEICRQAIEELHSARDDLNSKREFVSDRCDRIKADIASQKTRERDLQDNMKLRVKMIEEREFSVKVDELNKEIGDMDSTSIFEERKGLNKKAADLFHDKSVADGGLKEVKKSISGFEADLQKPHIKFAEKNFCDASVHSEVLAQTKNDLDNFYQALDWAMMSYHQKKIKHINTVINELWRRVYSGNDVDSIQIIAERDATASATKRRAFKYRVMQTKCGSDIEMRGRCSAGQKVLACLIIRIALAETFSSHCGVLALDEPTTNLDQENIINLSKVLLRLVRLQVSRKNFQLIVITHDQEFLKELTKLEDIDHFIKLERNSEGKSKVTKVNV